MYQENRKISFGFLIADETNFIKEIEVLMTFEKVQNYYIPNVLLYHSYFIDFLTTTNFKNYYDWIPLRHSVNDDGFTRREKRIINGVKTDVYPITFNYLEIPFSHKKDVEKYLIEQKYLIEAEFKPIIKEINDGDILTCLKSKNGFTKGLIYKSIGCIDIENDILAINDYGIRIRIQSKYFISRKQKIKKLLNNDLEIR